MPIYLDTRGNSVLSVAVCDRCNRKFAYTELMPDPNFPGMRVCKDDLDQYDPWRLPARQTENIALRHPRPDVSLARTNSQLLTQGTMNNYTPGNSIFIEGIPPYAGAQGDLSLNGGGFNTSGNVPVPVPPNAPTVTGFSPSSGSEDGGTVVTITGTGFSGTYVLFGNTYAEFTVINDTTIEAIAPKGIYGQSVRITVITQGGRGVSAQQYTYTAGAPKVYSITPNTGDIAGGDSVLIGGYRFTGATSITIGGTEVPSYTIIDDSRISATTPAHNAGAVNVTVTTPVGTGTGTNLFTYTEVPLLAPTVLSVFPNTGSVDGGTAITITGTSFVDVSSVAIGGIEVSSFTVVNDQNIETTTPTHVAGAVDITVTNPSGTGTGTGLFTYSANPPVPEAIYLTPGTTSWTVPIDWTSENMIELWGGGGGGGNAGSISVTGGSGGGGGGYSRIINTTTLTPGQTITVAVGAGGAAAPNGITRGGNGGTTTFGAASATGGTGGTDQTPGPGGSVSGGTGSGGDVNYYGGSGGGQTYSVDVAPGGDGEGDSIGGAAGGGMGFSNPNPTITGGDGAAGYGGAGGARGVSDNSPNGFPGADNAKGGGGGGSAYYSTGQGGDGGYPGGGGAGTFGGPSGNGADGVIKITYTRNPNASYAPFTTDGTYTVPAGVTQVKVLAVGHGGPGGNNIYSSSSGGGYGGEVIETTQPVTPGEVLTISLGSGNIPTSVAGETWTVLARSSEASAIGGFGYGGGGAGNFGANPGQVPVTGINGGAGGIGVLSTITGQYYGGGGGGAGAPNETNALGGAGGLGGGGNGGYGYANPPPQAGAANTGGGGGGGWYNGTPAWSKQGGTGFVAIQPITPLGPLKGTTINYGRPNNSYINGGYYLFGVPLGTDILVGDTVINTTTNESAIVRDIVPNTNYIDSNGNPTSAGISVYINNEAALPTGTPNSEMYNIYSSAYEIPFVVSENALIMYDFSNPACYPGTGSVVYDLCQDKHNASLVGSPTFVSNGAQSYIQLDGTGNQRVVFPAVSSVGFDNSWVMYAVIDYSRAVDLSEIFQSSNWGLFNRISGGSSTKWVTAYPTNPDGSPNLGPYSGGGSQGDAGPSGKVLIGMGYDPNTGNFTTVVNSANGAYIVVPTTMAKQADFMAALGKIYFYAGYQPNIIGAPSYSAVKAALQTRFEL